MENRATASPNEMKALVDDLLDHRLNRVTVDLPGKEGEMITS